MSHRETDKRLEKFVTYFVELFESYFSEYRRRLIERSPNVGEFVQLFEETVGISKSGGEVLEGVPKASTLIFLDLIVKGFKMKSLHDEWEKVKGLAPILLDDSKGNTFRNILIEAAGLIFAHFEAQFTNVTSDAGWVYAIRKIAKDAVNRVISYLRKSDMGTDEKAIIQVICQGLIRGKSETYSSPSGLPNFHKGHSVKLRVNDEITSPIKTTDMFENLGVKTKEKYYVPNVKKNKITLDRGVWFRLAFEWESESIESDKTKKLLPAAPREEYIYELNGQVPEEKLKSIKRIIEEEQSELEEIKNNAKIYADETKKIINENNEDFKKTLDEFKVELESLKEMSAETQGIAGKTLNEIKELRLEIREKLDQDSKMQEVEKPVWFNIKPPVPSFTGREQELATLHELVFCEAKQSYPIQITVIYGLGGMGKTQLARKYINEQRDTFFDIVWLNAENEGSLTGSFVQLAKNYSKIPTVDINGEKMTVSAIVKKVYSFFRDRKSLNDTLVVFDNAEDSYDITDFLPVCDPTQIHKKSHGKMRILITSRECEWDKYDPDIKKLPLQGYNLDDAVNFVHNSLNVDQSNNKSTVNDPKELPQQHINPGEGTNLAWNCQNNECDENKEIRELAETLQYFPLALEQAVVYIIHERMENINYSVSNYLEAYEEKTKELLDKKVFKHFCEEYENTTFATWNLTISKMSKLGFHGKLAIKIINIMAFIAPDDIQREIFIRLKGVKKSDVEEAVTFIVKYSMVNAGVGQEMLNINRLVQEVIRLQLQTNGDYEKYVNIVLELLASWHDHNEKLMRPEGISRIFKFSLPHMEAFLVHLTLKNQNDANDLQKLKELLHLLTEGYQFTQDLYRLGDVLVKKIENHRILQGNGTLSEADMLEKLADIYMELGKHSEAIRTHEQALGIYVKHKDQTLMAESHSKIADIYRATYEFGKSKKHYYEALSILDKHVKGKDSNHVVISKLSICLRLRLVDDSEATTDLLRQNIKYRDQGRLGFWDMRKSNYLSIVRITMELGEAYMRTGRGEKGSGYFKKSLEMCEECINDGLHYSRMMRIVNDLNVRGNLGLDVETQLKKSLSVMKEGQGPEHIETIKFMINFANFYFMKNNNENGFQLMEESLDIARRNNFVLSGILIHLGFKYNQTHNYGKALAMTNEGLSILESYHGESSLKLFSALEALALIYENLGKAQRQVEIYDRLLLITQQQCEGGDYRLAWVQVRYGKALERLRNMDKSRGLIEEGMPVLLQHFGSKERAEIAASKPLTTFC